MAKRVVVKPGYIYEVKINDREKCYFQNLGKDTNFFSFGSNAVRVFKKKYPLDIQIPVNEIVSGDVLFYTHIFIGIGVRHGFYNYVGKSSQMDVEDLYRVEFYNLGKEMINKDGSILEEWSIYHFGDNDLVMKIASPKEGDKYVEIGGVLGPPHFVNRLKNDGRWGYDPFKFDIDLTKEIHSVIKPPEK